jgi:hypothetical protein
VCSRPFPILLISVNRPTAARAWSAVRDPSLLQHPHRVQLVGRLDDPGQHQLAEHLVAVRRSQAQRPVPAVEGVQRVAIREDMIGSGPDGPGSRPRSSSSCPAAIRWPAESRWSVPQDGASRAAAS